MVRESDLVVLQASANAARFLGLDEPILGQRLDAFPGDLAESLRPTLAQPVDEIPIAVRCRSGNPPTDLDGLIHRPPSGGLVVELERAGPGLDLSHEIADSLQAIRSASSLQELCDETARIFKRIAGYDRAMVYRFDSDGHGEVFSEARNPGLDSYLGQRYPASDIPQIARRLYARNRIRVLVSVDDPRVPIVPALSPITGENLDMSLCFLRAMSPIHIQYLQNMGVAATLVASLMVGGKLWGLVACHHYQPRFVHYEVRAVCELLAESVAMRIAALESFAQAQSELAVRRLEQRIVEVISRDGDWRTALFDGSPSLLHPLTATGAALLFEDEVLTVGEVPGTKELREIGSWLDGRASAPIFSTPSLGLDEPAFDALSPVASGLMAASLSSSPGEYLLWFRPARVRTITWGGNPFKPFVVGTDPSELSPRRSFAQWHQQVQGTSDPWLPADHGAARLIGEIISDVVVQFRSVRVLIAQDQLDTVRQQVQRSEHPVIIADADGRILLTNESFATLVEAAHPPVRELADLPFLFVETDQVRAMLSDLVGKRRSCRGEVRLCADIGDGEPRPLLVRGDPVLAAPGRLLGFVIFVNDQTERRAAEAARRRFQEGLIAQHPAGDRGVQEDPTYRHLIASVLGNAHLAALEITDGVDPSRMPRMLEGVRDSVDRVAELLEHLVSHASKTVRTKS